RARRRADGRRPSRSRGGVSTETVTGETPLAQQRPRPARSVRAGRVLDGLIRSVVPVALALGAGAILLLALGRHPLAFYGALWTLVPAVLKARYGTNEIITTLMMSFIGIDLASILIKGPFHDSTTPLPQTAVLTKMLPSIPGTRIHVGLLVAFAAVLVVHYVLTRTSWGLRLQIMGANPRAARHFGIDLPRLIVVAFLVSGFLVGLAAAADILGLQGYIRTGWNPAYGDTIIPFVFLARLNALAVVPFIAFFSVVSTGGDIAASDANLSTNFLLGLVGLILLFMTVIEYLGRRREFGASYLTPGLRQALRAPLVRRRSS